METEQAVPTVAEVEPSHPYADIPGEHYRRYFRLSSQSESAIWMPG